jgi:hypothetical protein
MLASHRDVCTPGSLLFVIFWEGRVPDTEEEMVVNPAGYGPDSMET